MTIYKFTNCSNVTDKASQTTLNLFNSSGYINKDQGGQFIWFYDSIIDNITIRAIKRYIKINNNGLIEYLNY